MSTTKSPFSMQIPQESTGFLLWQVTNLWQRKIKLVLKKYRLTHVQFVLITAVYWFELNNQTANQINLSKTTKVDAMTTSTVIRTLATKNLLTREENSKDSRSKTVTLTKKGLEIAKITIPLVENFDQQFFSGLKGLQGDFNKSLNFLLDPKSTKATKISL